MKTQDQEPNTRKLLALTSELKKDMGDYGNTPGVNEVVIQVIVANAKTGAFDVFSQSITEKERNALSWLTPICTMAAAQSVLDATVDVESKLHGQQVQERFLEYYVEAVTSINADATKSSQ